MVQSLIHDTLPLSVHPKKGKDNGVANTLSKRYILIYNLSIKEINCKNYKELDARSYEFMEFYKTYEKFVSNRYLRQDYYLFPNNVCWSSVSVFELLFRAAHEHALMIYITKTLKKKDIQRHIKPRQKKIIGYLFDFRAQVKHEMERPAAAPPWIIKTRLSWCSLVERLTQNVTQSDEPFFPLNFLIFRLLLGLYFTIFRGIRSLLQGFIWDPGEASWSLKRMTHQNAKHMNLHTNRNKQQGKYAVGDAYNFSNLLYVVVGSDLRSNPFQEGEDDVIVTSSEGDEPELVGAKELAKEADAYIAVEELEKLEIAGKVTLTGVRELAKQAHSLIASA